MFQWTASSIKGIFFWKNKDIQYNILSPKIFHSQIYYMAEFLNFDQDSYSLLGHTHSFEEAEDLCRQHLVEMVFG